MKNLADLADMCPTMKICPVFKMSKTKKYGKKEIKIILPYGMPVRSQDSFVKI